jgi:MFS family permease
VSSLAAVFVLRFGVTFCVGGLEPVFQSWVAKSTPYEDRGLLFGWLATVRALGWACAPLISGLVAAGLGIRAVFLTGGGLFLITAAVIPALFRRISRSTAA